MLAEAFANSQMKDNGAVKGVSFASQIEATGYDHKQAMSEWVERYKSAFKSIVMDKAFAPEDLDNDGDLETKCNLGLHHGLTLLGYSGFVGLRANDIVALMDRDDDWKEDRWEYCLKKIGDKCIAVAGWANPSGIGHVAALYPGAPIYSGKWAKSAPLCANIGVTNGIMGVNYAFKEMPRFWWRQM